MIRKRDKNEGGEIDRQVAGYIFSKCSLLSSTKAHYPVCDSEDGRF